MKARVIIIAAMLLMLAGSAYALEITPTRKIFDFEPGKAIEGSFTVIKGENQGMKLAISARGELADYIKLKDFVVDLSEKESEKEFSYTIQLPSSFDKPGTHEGEIVVVGVPQQNVDLGTYVGTSITLATKIRVMVPYPGLYAEGRLDVTEANVNESVTFILPVSNLGSIDINSAQGIIDIQSPTYDNIATVQTPKKPVKAKSSEELITSWQANVGPGVYQADATVTYDEKTFDIKKTFSVGNLLIELLSLNVKDFKLGGIAKIILTVKNKWNSNIENVYASITVYNDKGTIVSESKSAPIDMKGQSTDTLNVYWDTQGLPSGTYSANIAVVYADKRTEKTYKLNVMPDRIESELFSGKAIEEKAGSTTASTASMISIIFLVVGILVAINIGLFIYLRRTIGQLKK
ncbi:MAG: hypothetical protein AABX51_04265 [Nanoarchaeota archaeon]